MKITSKSAIFIFVLTISLTSCKKKSVGEEAIEVFPGLVGNWDWPIACYDPCPSIDLVFDGQGNGKYRGFFNGILPPDEYEGEARIMDDSILYINGFEMFKVNKITDTIGYDVFDPSCYCILEDSLKFTRTMETSKGLHYQYEF